MVLLAVSVRVLGPAPAEASETARDPLGYITFCINVHDFIHPVESADTILRLISLFESYGVRGDFYFTEPIVHAYEEERPDVIERMRESGMTISYHLRPPHPAYRGFDDRLEGLSLDALNSLFRDYETYRLDLESGGFLRSELGGMTYLTTVFDDPPVACSIPFERWRPWLLPIWHEMGAQMTVTYHESGTDMREPYVWRDGLLIRPSDFSITRWSALPEQEPQFWWNMLDTPLASSYDPVARLKSELADWSGPRAPLITVLIHENNFYRQGATPWANIYYADKGKTLPLQQPFDLGAPDPSTARSEANVDAIWAAYERLVRFAAETLCVVTSTDIVELARAAAEIP